MGHRILIIGSGQLGTRHLQAVAQMPGVTTIEVVDPSPASLELGRARIAELGDAATPGIEYRWLSDVRKAWSSPDLVIVAAQSAGRAKLVADAYAATGATRWLLEKVVTRSVAEYSELMALAEAEALDMWVNCKTRAYSVHKHIKSLIPAGAPIYLSDTGGNHGLGNNGVHAADLFCYYVPCDHIGIVGSRIDDEVHASKRGGDVCDLSGTLSGSANGSDFVLSFAGSHVAPDVVTIVAPGMRFVVDHFTKTAWESLEADNWTWKPIPISADESWAVSHMTTAFATEIIEEGRCELPTLAECFPAHEFILDSLEPHFERLLGNTDGSCPIT